MSRLWPEHITVGLFPGHCWLQRGAAVDTHAGDFDSADRLLQALGALLDAQARPLRKGARVQFLVSDSLAHVMPLAWQELLTAPEEHRTYARLAFEQRGLMLDDGWLVQTGYRHFRAMGIAYAVSRQWMADLLAVMTSRGLKLASVLPVSAAAYWRQSVNAKGKAIVLLHESGRLTAMVMQFGRLQDLDVQPVAGPLEQAVTRLLKRIAITHGLVQQLGEWHAQADSTISLETIVAACLQDVAITRLPLQAWS